MRLPKQITIVQLFSIVIIVLSIPAVYYSYLLNKAYQEIKPADKSLSGWRFKEIYVDFSNLSKDKKAMLKTGDREMDNERHFIRAQILKIYNSDLNSTYAKIKLAVLFSR